ncbi:hypothetical protein [Chroococcidiopsis sp. CCMEE 29]|nr:hypothetical protein [Chroococcidiopsis sp. CCMEE 29]
MTRWRGTAIDTGLRAFAISIARAAQAFLDFAAIALLSAESSAMPG